VEVPCVKRNVIGAVNAVTATDMVMAGITSVIPADEVIDAMGEIGREMPKKFRETSEGGLAVTPSALKIKQELVNDPEL
jgi:L-serine dehydratase